ncbi:MAG: S8 family serine peptidase [Deferrisomatales bacterium]|nr:S8 family serine peptidase [Deferrisomatales bacterium]
MNAQLPQENTLADRDNDGLLNEVEAAVGTDPDNPDTDGDGIRDGVDPDVLSVVLRQLPEAAFKSEGEGHRTALLSLLDNNERHLLAGRIVQATHLLENLRQRMDGCPSEPDTDDWIVGCEAQQFVRGLLDTLLANHASFAVDGDIQPPVAALPGLAGGPDRPVGVALGPEGSPEPFVLDEVMLRPTAPGALDAFLAKYDGIVLHDGAPLLLPGAEPPAGLPDATGWYLIRVNPYRSSLEDLLANMERGGIRGHWVFSAEEAARLAALVAREWELGVSLNFTMELAQHSVPEHPDGSGGNLDASTWWWMTEDDDPGAPGDQGLSVGVVHAWEYVQYKGYPPVDVPYQPVRVAIIDTGFDLDETTGEPLVGAGDYPAGLLQLDEVGMDQTAGGAGYAAGCDGCWHGQLTFGTCCGLAQNGYGTAGTSFGWDIEPLVIKASSSLATVTRSVYSALYNGADVIHETLGFECGWWCQTFSGGDELKSVVKLARDAGVILVTPAQNQGRDIGGSSYLPCNVHGAVCVGAIESNGLAWSGSNWGSTIDIWAPTGVRSAITRESAAADPDDEGIDELHLYGGTSAATPYLTGIVALLKMVRPGITYEEVRTILVSTANPSTDPKVQDRGYVDAFRAVQV